MLFVQSATRCIQCRRGCLSTSSGFARRVPRRRRAVDRAHHTARQRRDHCVGPYTPLRSRWSLPAGRSRARSKCARSSTPRSSSRDGWVWVYRYGCRARRACGARPCGDFFQPLAWPAIPNDREPQFPPRARLDDDAGNWAYMCPRPARASRSMTSFARTRRPMQPRAGRRGARGPRRMCATDGDCCAGLACIPIGAELVCVQ